MIKKVIMIVMMKMIIMMKITTLKMIIITTWNVIQLMIFRMKMKIKS